MLTPAILYVILSQKGLAVITLISVIISTILVITYDLMAYLYWGYEKTVTYQFRQYPILGIILVGIVMLLIGHFYLT